MSSPADNQVDSLQVDRDQSTFLAPLVTDSKARKSSRRLRKNRYFVKSIHTADVEAELADGWELQRQGKTRASVKKQKPHDRLLEDRVWCLFCDMGYETLNGSDFKIVYVRSDGSTGRKQVDVYAEDNETAVVVECKSRASRGRRSLQKDILESAFLQRYFRSSINKRFEGRPKPKIIWVYATSNIIWSQQDLERAADARIEIITENELQYFDTFVKHMGPAGKYQILGDFLKGQKVPGLSEVKLPAIKGKIGGETFYSFVSKPRHLLKIAFVNHQALNHPDGRPAYQRMISSKRIKDIGAFIKSVDSFRRIF